MSAVPEGFQIATTLASVPGLLFGALVRDGRRGPALATDEAVLLQYSPRGRILLSLCVLTLAMVAAIPIGYPLLREPRDVPTVLDVVIALLVAALAVRLWLQLGVVVHADARGITVRNAGRSPQTISWADLHDVHFSLRPLGCRLMGANRQRLRFPGTLPGMTQLLTRIRRHVPSIRWRRWGREVQAFQEGQKMHQRQP